MPYKDPAHKRQWELRHRAQRLARRRELRQITAAQKVDQPEPSRVEDSAVGFLWFPIAGGVALASYSPKLAIGAGGLTLAAAAALRKNWSWWIVGTLLLVLGLFFQWNSNKNNKNDR
jgi:hypothetical protein